MTDDDWEPLPEEQRGRHPGELADAHRRVGAKPAVATPRAAPPPVVFEEPHDPVAEAAAVQAAEQALAELKARLDKARPATSLIAEVQHRELRAERKRKAAQIAASRGMVPPVAKVVVAPAGEPRGEVAVEIDPRGADIDPRETEPWFAELPKKEQERLRTHWWHERHRGDDAGVRTRRRIGRALGGGAALFLLMGFLQAPLVGSLAKVPALVVAGAIGAGLAEVFGGGRVRYAIAGALAFLGVMGAEILVQPFSMMSLMLCTYAMATLGMDGEMRRSGGFGDR